MITLFVWWIANGFIFHLDPKIITEEARIIITVIGISSDLNLISRWYRDNHTSRKEGNEK